MKRNRKRLTALALTLLLGVNSLPVTALAAEKLIVEDQQAMAVEDHSEQMSSGQFCTKTKPIQETKRNRRIFRAEEQQSDTYEVELDASMSEMEIVYRLCDAFKEALLNGCSKLSWTGVSLNINEVKDLPHFGYFCPYVDGEKIDIQMLCWPSSGDYAYIDINNQLSAEETQEWVDTIDQKLKQLIELADRPDLSEADRALLLHDYLTSHYHYHTGENLNHSAYVAIMLTEQSGICQSYSYLFQYVMNKTGVECYTTGSDAMNHAWNIIGIDGNYYHIDNTWDDPVEDYYGQSFHNYFLLSDAVMQDDDHEHYDWDLTEYSCSDDSYETAYFTSAVSPVVMNGDVRYYIDNAGLEKYRISDETTECIDNIDAWSIWDGSGTYSLRYSGLFNYQGSLYYNTPTQIKSCQMSTDSIDIYREIDTQNGYLYGLLCEGDRACYSLEQEPNVSYDRKTIASVPLDQTEREHEHVLINRHRKEATCAQEGYTGDQVCTICEKIIVKGRNIAKLAHQPELRNVKEASCTESGYTGETVCSVCDTVLAKGQNIDRLPHKTALKNVREATCTVTGYTGDTVCIVCDTVITKGKVIAKLPHTEVIDPEVKATYADTGLTEGSHCAVCDTVLRDRAVIPRKQVAGIKGLKLSNLSGRKLKMTWTASTKVTGYRIQYAANSRFKNAKTVTITSKKTGTKTVSGLKKDKKYYVRICGYKTYKGQTYDSEWSAAKSVTIKK